MKNKWNSNDAAAYPPDFNSFLAQAVAGFVRQRQADHSTPATRTTVPLRDPTRAETPPPGEPVAPAAVEALSNLFAKFNREADTPSVAAATDATTSTRRLDFGNDEVVPETLTGLPLPAPAAPKSKKVKFFEKTAGARATRSNNPTILRGMATSTGFGALALGAALSSAVFAMGTVNLFDELSKPSGSLSAALAKPSTADPKNQSEAYARDKPGWQTSEAKELKNHKDNGSWEYIDACQLPHGRRLVKLVWVYKVKRDGSLKSRLCVQGCRQVPGVDYDQT